MKITIAILLLFGTLAISAQAGADNKQNSGKIEGIITDSKTGSPIVGTTVYLADKFGGTIADENGRFLIQNLDSGIYALRIGHVGYETIRIDSVVVKGGTTTTVNVMLVEKPHELRGITVTPGRFSIMGTEATASQSLTRRELETTPQAGEDLNRAVSRLPGVVAEDMSSRFIVRGGEFDEVLVTLDGLQIYEPFHLKDFMGGLFSAINASAIEGVDLLTGGYTAQYGDRSSGVFNINTHRPPTGLKKVSAGVSFMNAHFMTEGTFAGNRGSWLLSGRRGYLDVLLKIAGEDENLKPVYYDFIGKLQYQLGNKHVFSTHFLHAGDRLRVISDEDNDADTIITSYDNSYGWFNLKSVLNHRLMGNTILSIGQVTHNRHGRAFWAYQQLTEGMINDEGNFTVIGFKSEWDYEVSGRYLLKAGIDIRSLSADYNYLFVDQIYAATDSTVILERIDTIQTNLQPSGNQVGAYLSHRFQVGDPLTLEFGGRFDSHSYTGDEKYSPRINMACRLGENTTLRGGWGYYYQAQRIDELSPGDRITSFQEAEKAEHKTLGLEHDFGTGVKLRIEAYHKKYSDLRPELRNSFDRLTGFPEYENDRAIFYRGGATSRGLELFLRREKGSKFTWMLSYALAEVEDAVDSVRFKNVSDPGGTVIVYNRSFPNTFDQRHTFYLDMSYRPNLKWQFNVAVSMHSGWPYTGVELRSGDLGDGQISYWINAGERLARRFPSYSRIDIRLNRYFDVWGGRLTAFLEVINVLDKENVRGYDYSIRFNSAGPFLYQETETNFSRLPILGVSYSLHM